MEGMEVQNIPNVLEQFKTPEDYKKFAEYMATVMKDAIEGLQEIDKAVKRARNGNPKFS